MLKEEINIKKCIRFCRYGDKIKMNWMGMEKLDHVGNIDYKFIVDLLEKQNYNCGKCMDKLLIHSHSPRCAYGFVISQIDQYKPHDKDNVMVLCYYCKFNDDYRIPKKKCVDVNCLCNKIALPI